MSGSFVASGIGRIILDSPRMTAPVARFSRQLDIPFTQLAAIGSAGGAGALAQIVQHQLPVLHFRRMSAFVR